MHEECQGSRSETPKCHKDIRGSTRERKDRPCSLRPSGQTTCDRALVGNQRSRPARPPPTCPQSIRQVRPGYTVPNPRGGSNNVVRAHTRACYLRLQTTTIRCEPSTCMPPQSEGAARRPFVRHPDMQSSRDWTQAQPDYGRHELADSWLRTSG